MTFSFNDKRLWKISFALAPDNPYPKQTSLFIFTNRGYFQTRKFLLLGQQTRPKDLCEFFCFVHLLVFTTELTLQFLM